MPELVVENPLDERVLLYDGEELVGAKQNRILNVSVLVEAKSTLQIPVSCVEQGRWSRASASFSLGQPRLARAAPPAQGRGAGRAADGTRRRAERRLGRAARADGRACRSTRRPVRAADLYRARDARPPCARGRVPAQPGQCGAFLGLGDDILRRRRLAAGRVRATLAEAPRRLPARCARAPRRQADAVRGRSRRSSSGSTRPKQTRQPSAGLGEDVRLRGEHVIGSGLELDGELIQLSAFRSRDGGRRAFGRIARPSARR